MKKYIAELKLDYDPFEPGIAYREFFEGGDRRLLINELIEQSVEGSMLAVVTGPIGSGKSTLARELRRSFGSDAICLLIPATLFMNRAQFLEAVSNQLPKHKHIASAPSVEVSVSRLKQFAAELDLEAQALVLMVDDAHELSAEVLELIENLSSQPGKSSVHIMLLGERQLTNLLQNALSDASQANLVHFELAGFSTEDTLEYLQLKLAHAGLRTSLPFSGRTIGEIQNATGGMPAAINALASDYLLSGSESVLVNSVEDSTFADPDLVPEDKKFNFDAHDHMQFDLDMAETDEAQDFASQDYSTVTDDEQSDAQPIWLAYVIDRPYQFAASVLGILLVGVLLIWNSGDAPAIENLPMELATRSDTGNINRIQLAAPILSPESEPITADPLLAASSNAVASTERVVATNQVSNLPLAEAMKAESESESESEAGVVPVAKIVATEKQEPPVDSRLTGFEQNLMKLAANSYTIQILGSHSEANVQKFIESKALPEKHGYYQTRHQNKPWFVVVAGNYSDRSAASAIIAGLPPSLRDMQPWIRLVGDIQGDIRQLTAISSAHQVQP